MLKHSNLLYEGKGKKVYESPESSDKVILFFKNDLTAYQAQKTGTFEEKGKCCCQITSLIFQFLKKEGIKNHWLKDLSDREILCLRTEILPLEVVIRNRLAGSTAKRLGLKEGLSISSPLLEFYYKRDDLNDPFCSEEQIIKLNLIKDSSWLSQIKNQALLINEKLRPFFSKAGIELIDFKLEFGIAGQELILADEISPDSCRLWDNKTGYKMDKDRFRLDLGGVDSSYQLIKTQLFKTWSKELL